MTDRKLLEAAAKAAGLEFKWEKLRGGAGSVGGYARARQPGSDAFPIWRPLTDDGDALRLAVALRMNVVVKTLPHAVYVEAYNGQAPAVMETLADVRGGASEPAAATRRAIVRAAAALAHSA